MKNIPLLLLIVTLFGYAESNKDTRGINPQVEDIIAKVLNPLFKKESTQLEDLKENQAHLDKEQKQQERKQKEAIVVTQPVHVTEPELVMESSVKAQNTVVKQDKEIKVKQSNAKKQAINFIKSDQTYYAFGSSEIHGHVRYLNKKKQEITMSQNKVYLLDDSDEVREWYENKYLKNKSHIRKKSIPLGYMHRTQTNQENEFSFYGVVEGDYYIIVESAYPSSLNKTKKVYVARKVEVDKKQKAMVVLSKILNKVK